MIHEKEHGCTTCGFPSYVLAPRSNLQGYIVISESGGIRLGIMCSLWFIEVLLSGRLMGLVKS